MILADKIIKLRKQRGWSQEELAMMLSVSRQSVSKWESMASIPDLDKIIKLSEIFGVSTDYLLKDEFDNEKEHQIKELMVEELEEDVRKVSMEEANTYMSTVEAASMKIALGVILCILCPVVLILLNGLADCGVMNISESVASGIGLAVLLGMIVIAVALFIMNGMKLEKYEYLENEILSLEYGIASVVEKKKETFEPIFRNGIAIGVCSCIVSFIPLVVSGIFKAKDIIMTGCLVFLFFAIAFGVFIFVRNGMIWESYEKLLEEGDYSCKEKRKAARNSNLNQIYWCIVTAIYLGISFWTMRWDITWIIWPVAGVLYGAVEATANMIRKK